MAKISDFIRRDGVTLYMGALTAGEAPTALTGYTEITHIQGNLQINDSRNTITVKDFGTDYTSFDLQAVDGRTGSISHNLNLVPSDVQHQALKTNYENATPFALLIVAKDGKGTGGGKYVDAYEVQIQTFPRTYNESGVATAQITYMINGLITPPTGV